MYQGQILNAVNAGVDQTSVSIECDSATYASFQFSWAGLTGTLDAVVQIQVSDSNGIFWDDKTGAVYMIATADGSQSISLNNVVTSDKIRLAYIATGVTGGTFSAYATVKGLS